METLKRIVNEKEKEKKEREAQEQQEEYKLGCKISRLIWNAPGHLQETLVSRIVDREVLRIRDPIQKKMEDLERSLERIESLAFGVVDLLEKIETRLIQDNHLHQKETLHSEHHSYEPLLSEEKDPSLHIQVVKEAELKVPNFESWVKERNLNFLPSSYSPQYHPSSPAYEMPHVDLIQQTEQKDTINPSCCYENNKLSHEVEEVDSEVPKEYVLKDSLKREHTRKTLHNKDTESVDEDHGLQKRHKVSLEKDKDVISLFK